MASPSTMTAGASLEASWSALLRRARSDRVFALPAWKQAWRETLGADAVCETVSLEEHGEWVALAPLVRVGQRLEFDGGHEISDYLDLLVVAGREAELTPRLLDAVADREWTRLQLDCLPAASPTPALAEAWARGRGYRVARQQQTVAPVIAITGDWEAYLTGLDKKDRHELRRKLRRLEAAGDVELDLLTEADGLDAAMDDFLRLLRLSDHHKAEFMTPPMEGFFRAMARATFHAGVLRLYRLRLEGVAVSAVICFDDDGESLMLYNSGFDPAYGQLSVGLLLKVMCLQEAIGLGKRVYDTLRGDERYKYDLGAVDRPLWQVVIERGAA